MNVVAIRNQIRRLTCFKLPASPPKRGAFIAVFLLAVIGFGILLQSMLVRPVFATSVTNYPTATGTNSWTSPTNADANDTNNATAAPGKNATVNGIWQTFGFGTLPSNAVINSVAINVRYMISATNTVTQLNATALYGGTACGTAQSDTSRPTAMTVKTFDVTSCRSWAVADLNDTNFSVQIGAQNGNTRTTYTFSMDYVSVTVGYTVPTTFTQASYRVFNNTDTTASGASTPSFAAAVNYTTDSSPVETTTADFNGDGKVDIAVTNSSASDVGILLGNGDGTFAAQVTYATGSSPLAVKAADLNNDGKLDLVVSNKGGNSISVFLGNGDGTFAAQVSYSAGTQPYDIVIADFNGDGKPDVATANDTLSGNVSVFLGNGDGTFAASVAYSAGSITDGITAADFNKDGKIDIVAANYSSNNVSLFLGNGDGTFATQTTITTGTSPTGVVAADVNGDGNQDMVVGDYGSTSVSVILGNGDGTFAAKVDYTTGANPNFPILKDFNGDGKLDIAIDNQGAATVSVLTGNGDGTFAAKTDFATGSIAEYGSSGDFNGDGKPDLAVPHDTGGSTVGVLLNTTAAGTAPIDVGTPLAGLNAAATVPGDGQAFRVRMDVAIGSANLAANGQNFKLQYADNGTTACTTAPTSWSDVTDTSTVQYYDNPVASNSTTLSTSTTNDVADGTNTIIHETYQEKGTTSFTNPTAINTGQDGMWDFALTTHQTLSSEHYCLRITSSSGTALNAYTTYPELIAPPSTYRQGAYRWFKNSGSTAFTSSSSNPATSADSIARGVQYDTNGNMYTAGFCGGQSDWCAEKRNSGTGALSYTVNESGFTNGGQGVYGLAIDQANDAMFMVGYDSNPGSTNQEWRIEKRTMSTGALVSGFGTGGIITENISANGEEATGVAIDSSGGFIYVIGQDSSGTTGKWRLEKRSTSTGALSYGVSESISANSDLPQAIKLDLSGGYAYMVGYDQINSVPTQNEWRIEKRTLSNGALVTGFGTSGGISESISTGTDEAYDLALDASGGYLYVAGSDNNAGSALEWRMEKRSTSTGALVSGFGTGGAISEHISFSSDEAYTIQADPAAGYIYVGGYDESPSGSYQEWRIEKRSTSTGGLVSGFGTSGAVTERISTSNDVLYASAIDVSAGAIYVVGDDSSSGVWYGFRTEKRNTSDGSFFNGINMSPLAGQDKALDLTALGSAMHLKVAIGAISSGVAASGQTFKLQYANKAGTCAASSYSDVTSSTPIQWFNDTNIAAGATVGTNANDPIDGSNSNVYETYQEANSFSNASQFFVGQDGLWDLSLTMPAGLSPGTDICLRFTDGAGTPISTYNVYPEIQFGPATVQRLRMGKFFDSNHALQPYFTGH